MRRKTGATIAGVQPGGIAAELELRPGDRLLSINGRPVADMLDIHFYTASERLTLEAERRDGELWELEVEKGFDEDLGLSLDGELFDGVHICRNKCVFCFLAQQPKGMRKSLYIKDDDYRLSFMHGNFITLTDLPEEEERRIKEQRLTPLYVSVHATDDELRDLLFGTRRARGILPRLQGFIDAGIELHTQLVLCPGLNDGPHLDRSVADLSGLGPSILSISAVPVGLTKHRDGLYPLRVYTAAEANRVIDQATAWQRRFRQERGTRLVWASDEFYLLAGRPLPGPRFYEGYGQLSNGVGMVRNFSEEFRLAARRLPEALPEGGRRATVLTGRLAAPIIAPMLERLNRVTGVELRLEPVVNEFFGQTVTAAGLLTGQDIAAHLRRRLAEGDGDPAAVLGEEILIPDVMLKEDAPVFLDDMTVQDVAVEVGVPIRPVPVHGRALVQAALGRPVTVKGLRIVGADSHARPCPRSPEALELEAAAVGGAAFGGFIGA